MHNQVSFSPVILHIPHSSAFIPEEYRRSFFCDPSHELAVMTDLYTDELFACGHEAVVFPISRLICDVERFRDDKYESMSARGMGAVYTKCHDGKALRSIMPGERESILCKWYDPHHAALEAQVEKRLDAFGRCIVIDCHSFSPTPLPHEPDQCPDRPDSASGQTCSTRLTVLRTRRSPPLNPKDIPSKRTVRLQARWCRYVIIARKTASRR